MSKLYLIAQIYCHFIFTPAHRNTGPGSTSSIKPQKHFEGVLNRDGGGGGGEGELGLECKVEKLKYNGWRSCIQDQKGCGGG